MPTKSAPINQTLSSALQNNTNAQANCDISKKENQKTTNLDSKNIKPVQIKNSAFNETMMHISFGGKIYFPPSSQGYKILALLTWNPDCAWDEFCSYIIDTGDFEDFQIQDFAKYGNECKNDTETLMKNAQSQIDSNNIDSKAQNMRIVKGYRGPNLVLQEIIKMPVLGKNAFILHNDKNVTITESCKFLSHNDQKTYKNTNYAMLSSFLLFKGGKWDHALPKDNEIIEIEEKYDFSHLVVDVKNIAEIINEWCFINGMVKKTNATINNEPKYKSTKIYIFARKVYRFLRRVRAMFKTKYDIKSLY